MSYNKIIEELIAENEQLKHEIDKQKNYNMSHAQRISELKKEKRYWLDNFKRVRDDKMELIDEHEQLKQRISKLVSENTNLQNDLFSEQLLQDETDDYINSLKKEIDDFYYEQSKLKESDFYIKALKNQLFKSYLKQQQQERLITELKTALSSYNNFVDEMFPD